MAIKSHYKMLCTAIIIAGIGACGGGGGSSSTPQNTVPAAGDSEATTMIRQVQSEEELAASLRAGLSRSAQSGGLVLFEGDLGAAEAESEGNFTFTNLQEANVDEADVLKYDGEILYVVHSDLYQGLVVAEQAGISEEEAAASAGRIHLLKTDALQATVEPVSTIEFEQDGHIDELYLYQGQAGKQLIGLRNSSRVVPWLLFSQEGYWTGGETGLTIWNVDNPNQPARSWQIELDGSLLDSRRIGDKLYLITRYSATVDGVVPYPETEEDQAANEQRLREASLAQLLPKYRLNGGPDQELLSADDCYLPNPDFDQGPAAIGGGGVVSITEIDLTAPAQLQSLCVTVQTSGFYVSSQSLYITASTGDNSTQIHKISLTDQGPQYRGSGEIPGYIGTSNPAFLMSEQGRDLRVFSSYYTNQPNVGDVTVQEGTDRGPHRLTVLRENSTGTALEPLSQLPSDAQPAAIGKPGEAFYAARFLGDRAYAVTFEVVDPLYVFDLSEPESPRITGELEIPGFSTQLQPLGPNLLLGVGRDVPAEAEGLVQGVKVALFDVSDTSSPVVLGQQVIGKRGSNSPALYNHHSITVQTVDQGYRVALPVVRHDTEGFNPGDVTGFARWYEWTDSSLYKFEIDSASGQLTLRDSLLIEQRDEETRKHPLSSLYEARSVLHDDALFFVNGEKVWSQQW